MERVRGRIGGLIAKGFVSASILLGVSVTRGQSTLPIDSLPLSPAAKSPVNVQPGTKSNDNQNGPGEAPRTIERIPEPQQPKLLVESSAPTCALECETGFDWSKVWPVRPTPRPGFFAIPPSGPGYYSLLDVVTDNYRAAPPRFPYPPSPFFAGSFFDADFRYLDDPENTQTDPFDALKRIHLGDNWMFSTGGEFRTRGMWEHNSRLTGTENNYDLTRTRVYGDLWYKDQFRFYVEGIGAWTTHQTLTPLVTDADRGDFLNLFVEAKLMDIGDSPVYARVGRQELLFGSQRLISPLDWANTRRTFEGARVFRRSEKLDVDLFWVQPVVPDNIGRISSVDDKQNFAGAWATYRPNKQEVIDFYYLFLDNANHGTQQNIRVTPYNVHTIGSRYAGDRCNFLWDVEAALQLGDRQQQNIIAGKANVGLGYHFAELPLNQTFWVYYDYASGSKNPNGNTDSTFNQLFPFNHYYSGWIDLVGPQNLHDLNLQYYIYPTNWVTLWAQWHNFWLDSGSDALYNKGGAAFRRSANGTAGTYVGNELDLISTFHVGPHSDIMASYGHLFGGGFLRKTSGKTGAASSESFDLMYTFRW